MSASIFDTIDPKMLQRIQSLRLMDDDFMTVVFGGDNEATEFLLRILLERDDLHVTRSMTQKEKRNLFGRSVKLDIIAEDAEKKQYNVEIQRENKGASPKRVRYNVAMLDSHTLKKKDDFSALPELYVIFITEHDFLKLDKPIYKVRKLFDYKDSNGNDLPFYDGCNIMYVNGAYRGEDAIGKLMHDFCTPDAGKMYYSELADRVRFHKQDEKGAGNMCQIIEEYGNERAAEGKVEGKIEIAEKLIRDGSFSLEKISELADIPFEQIKQMASNLSVSVEL